MKANKEIFIRSSINDIEEYFQYLYEKILLLCESSEIAKMKGIRIDTKPFKSISHLLNYKETATKSNKRILKQEICVEKLENMIFYVPKGNKITSLLNHIRNAFAHNLIVIDSNNIMLGDYLSRNKNGVPVWEQPTMLGRISKENFELLISTLTADCKLSK